MAKLSFDISTLRVLLVEDDEFAREQELTALRHIGVKLLSVAEDGDQALEELIKGVPYDLVVEMHPPWPGAPWLALVKLRSRC